MFYRKLTNLYMYSLLLLSAVSSLFGSFFGDFESIIILYYIIKLNAL